MQIDYDLFETMAERGLHYGYTELSTESPVVTKYMWNFAQDYVNTHLMEEEQERARRNQVRLFKRVYVIPPLHWKKVLCVDFMSDSAEG